MKTAPSISFQVERSRAKAAFLATAWLGGAGICWHWYALRPVNDWRVAFTSVVVVLSGAAAIWGWRQSTLGVLRWDRREWWFEPSGAEGQEPIPSAVALTVIFDFQFFVLLSLKAESCPVFWLWLDRSFAPTQWHRLRCALFSAVPQADVIAEPKIVHVARGLNR